MHLLMTVIAAWLSVNFGLPATFELPNVEYVEAERMAEVRAGRVASHAPHHGVGEVRRVEPGGAEGVFSMYDDASRTIYLPTGWHALGPADGSLLAHEMVHHLQNVAGLSFACAGGREKAAYRAQRSWLGLFGLTLEDEFGLDPMTVVVRTNCFH